MSLSELERLVGEAEADASLRQALRRCGSERQLILTARQLGFRITRLDLQRAWQQISTTPRPAPLRREGDGIELKHQAAVGDALGTAL
jgi:hypothetical protein